MSGALDEAAAAEALAEARDNAEIRHGRRARRARLARRRRAAAARPVAGGARLVPDRRQGGARPRARTAGPRRRPSHPPGRLLRLRRRPRRDGDRDFPRHRGGEPADAAAICSSTPSPATATTPRRASATRWDARPPTSTSRLPRADAVDRATRLLGAKKPRSAKLTAVLDRRVTATLLGILSGTLSGEEVAKGRSLFEGRVGEQVGVGELTLVDDPTNPLAYGAARHDAEGLACRRNSLIETGELKGFLYDTYAGRLAGVGFNRLGGSRRVPDDSGRRCAGPVARCRGTSTRRRSSPRSPRGSSSSRSRESTQGSTA